MRCNSEDRITIPPSDTTSCQIVNIRRPIVTVLLSLLLVLTQQMAFTHALSHWTANRSADVVQLTAQPDDDSGVSKAQSFDQSCEQCLAFAQIGTPIEVSIYSFPVAREPVSITALKPAAALCPRAVCVFHSRAPPVLA